MHDKPRIFLFISTGRCGTQWLATNLDDLYRDQAVVTHEPLGPRYRPREFFRAYDQTALMEEVAEVAAHLDRIAQIEQRFLYIETGWPLFATIPLFVERFGSLLGLVHLTRHPVPSAISHMVHHCYGGSPRDDDYTRLAALDPMCPRVFQPQYAELWRDLSPYEKCLFWWTEVQLYAEEIEALYPEAAFYRVKSEEMLEGGEALAGLIEFLGLPHRDELTTRTRRRVDEWSHQTELEFEWRKVYNHRPTLDAAAALGYDAADVDEAALTARYKGPPHVERS